MNPNIKVINKNLWTVNFSYVGMDFIRELTFKESTASDFMTLTQDGKLAMNSGDEVMMKYLPVMKVVMSFPNRLLGTDKGFCAYIKVFVPSLDKLSNDKVVEYLKLKDLYNSHKAIFETACKWELKRRQLHRQYIKDHWFLIILNKILKGGEF